MSGLASPPVPFSAGGLRTLRTTSLSLSDASNTQELAHYLQTNPDPWPSSLPWKNRFTGVFPANPFMRAPKREAIPKPVYITASKGDRNSEKLVAGLSHLVPED